MKIVLFAILIGSFLLVSQPAFAWDATFDANLLIDRQKSYFDAIIRKDYQAVDGLLARNYYATYALGIIDRAREMKDVREFPLVSYNISDSKVVFLDKRHALVSFKLHVKVVVEGKDLFEDDFLTCVWSKAKSGWQMSEQTAVKAAKTD